MSTVAGDLCNVKSAKASVVTAANVALKSSSTVSIDNVSEANLLQSTENIACFDTDEKLVTEDKVALFVAATADSSTEATGGSNRSSLSFQRITVGDRLLKTEKIWYLPVFAKSIIIERLRNKPCGVKIET
jgi:hypothetical protein